MPDNGLIQKEQHKMIRTKKERLESFDFNGIKKDTKVFLTRVSDPYEYELTVRGTNILNKVDLPFGETTVEELLTHRWMTIKVVREYIEEGILKKVTPKGKSIKDTKVQGLLKKFRKIFMKVYFPKLS